MSIAKITIGVAFVVALCISLGGAAQADTLLLQDTFNNTIDSGTSAPGYIWDGFGINAELNQSYRQTGLYANTTYAYQPLNSGVYDQVNNVGLGAAGKLVLLTPGWVSPNHDFSGADSLGGVKVSFDATVPSWNWVQIGTSSQQAADQSTGITLQLYTDPAFGAAQGLLHVGVNNVPFGNYAAVSPASATAEHHWEYVFTDPTDNHPFNGTGNVNVKGYVDNSTTPFLNIDLGVDFANNFISLAPDNGQSTNWTTFDNLTISQVPEPSTLLLVGTGLAGLLCYAWRKRK